MNRYIALFICTVIDKACQKYKHSGKWTRKAMAKEKIKLPVTDNDEPDYRFMENYMKMLEKKILMAKQWKVKVIKNLKPPCMVVNRWKEKLTGTDLRKTMKKDTIKVKEKMGQ